MAQVLITTIAIPMCFIGLCGNFCLLWATATDKHLQQKIYYIVAVIAFLHVFCLLSELYLEAQQLRFHAIPRSECFRQTCVYVFAIVAQSAMVFMLALDHLFAVVIPLRHHVISTLPYVFCMCVPPFLLAFAIIVTSIIFMNEEEIDFCTPITAMPHEVEWLSYIINVLNIGVIIVLLSAVKLFGMNKRTTNNTLSVRSRQEVSRTTVSSQSSSFEELKMIRAFSIMMVVFVCSWCSSAVITHIALRYLRKELSLVVQTYTVILALPSYCQCYFVSYFRSPRHRSAYHKQLQILFPCFFGNK